MSNYESNYSEGSFWEKLKKHAIEAGKKVVYSALLGYYAVQNPGVPLKAKSVIYGALGYLILPIDLVPDLIPVIGYGDDLSALLLALGTVAVYINKDVKRNALNKMEDWFGQFDQRDKDIIDVDAKIIEVEKGIGEAAASSQPYGDKEK
ncbi:YkvA family protein [Paenibacillus contaminans]|uniref:DUF1232 domain-containing protein n=1 Tax=Paenibacillus contaminans TaxID=450362 RepID=A0A329MP54_9BACL|nr:DUF1232 domain-containing protein [Paenibacillus contaminans]RAV19707.1 DUF1232 domain-containing protein [Paenibacillus contaminans]